MQAYTHYHEADELIKNGQLESALALLDKAVNLHPSDANALHDRAVCLFRLHRPALAMADLDRAALLEPDNAYRYASRGFIRAALKDTKGAMDDYQRALALDPEDAITQNNLGLLEEQMGYAKEAKERFEVADELRHIMEDSGIGPAPELPETPPAAPTPTPAPTLASHVRMAITNKRAFREFVAFCRNGFKLP